MSASQSGNGFERLSLPLSSNTSHQAFLNSSTQGDVALFVDWENLKASLNKTGLEPNVSSLRDTAEQYGRVVLASAYADWQDPWHHRDPGHLYSAGIEPVYVPTMIRYGAGGVNSPFARRRNSVDIKLTADCIECCFKYPNLKTFILVSGDGDFVHLVNTLRPYGREVVAVGVSWSTSVQLAESVDQLLYYDQDIEPIEPPAGSVPARQFSEQDENNLQDAFERVVGIIRSSQNGGRALLSWVKHELIKRYGSFNEKQWGFTQFKGFMREAEARGLVHIVERDLVNWAYLPEAWEQSERHAGARGNGVGRGSNAGRPNNIEAIHEQLVRFAHDVEMKFPYVSFTFLHDRLTEAQLFPYSHQEISDLLNEAVEEMVFLHSSFQDTRSGSVKTIRTITLNHSHPEVARALGEAPMPPRNGEPVEQSADAGANLPGLMKPGGDSRLAEDLRELARRPNNAAVEQRVGERLFELGRCAEAVDHLRRATELDAGKLEYHCTLARALREERRTDEALQVCQGAAHLFPQEAVAQRLLADVLMDAGRREEALTAYKRVLELMPDDGDVREEVWLEIVKIYRAAEDDTDSACDAVRAALEDLPESERLQAAWRQVQEDDSRERAERLGRQATSLVSRLGREDEVISLAQEALQLSDQVYQPFYALGEIYMRRGNLEKAVDCFERAIPVCPSPGAIYSMRMRLVGLYEKLGRREAAEEVRSLLG